MSSRDSDTTGTPLAVFGAMLRYYRNQAGLSQADLAARTYVSHDVISKVETGQRVPTAELVAALEAVPELGARGALAELREQMKDYLKYRASPDWFRDWTKKEAAATPCRVSRWRTLAAWRRWWLPGIRSNRRRCRVRLPWS